MLEPTAGQGGLGEARPVERFSRVGKDGPDDRVVRRLLSDQGRLGGIRALAAILDGHRFVALRIGQEAYETAALPTELFRPEGRGPSVYVMLSIGGSLQVREHARNSERTLAQRPNN